MSESAGFVPLAAPSKARGLALLEEIVAEIEASEFRTWDQSKWIGRLDASAYDDDDEYDESVSIPLDAFTPGVRERMVPAFDCGTVCCLFGHAVFKAGATMAEVVGEYDDGAEEYADVSTSMITLPGSTERANVSDYARELLGLSSGMARWLSNANREWAEVTEFMRAWQDDAAAGPDSTEHRMAVIRAISGDWW